MENKIQEIKLYYLGKPYPLVFEQDGNLKKATLTFDGSSFKCECSADTETELSLNLNQAIQTFYSKKCKALIEERLRFYQPQFKVKYKSVAIENSNTKWGTCSSQRNLTFHWKLMMFPISVIDYVVVHELCHLVHMNHDRSFWRLVGKVCPDFKTAMEMLGTEKTRDL